MINKMEKGKVLYNYEENIWEINRMLEITELYDIKRCVVLANKFQTIEMEKYRYKQLFFTTFIKNNKLYAELEIFRIKFEEFYDKNC